MNRADLLALTGDSLVALTNRGLFKRATKEVEAGSGPKVEVDSDGTVRGSYPDGVEVLLPAGAALDVATCSCPATGPCRHLVALVLAYQAQAANQVEIVEWSPGDFTDAQLEELVGSRALATARRAMRAGYSARIRRPTPEDPVPSVELAACVVRFLVPHELGYVHTDASAAVRDRVVPLAVWAFRVADQRHQESGVETEPARDQLLDVGGGQVSTQVESGLGPALALTEEILLDGVVHSGPALAATIATVRRDLDTAGLRWPVLALDDLTEQLEAYRNRSATYQAERAANLIAELHARNRASVAGASPRSRVLGTEEAASTPLRRLCLTSLGCRVSSVPSSTPGAEPERMVQVYLAHPDAGTVLVLKRSWGGETERNLTGHQLARKQVGGVRLYQLSSGDLVSETAVRSASRTVRLGTGRVAKSVATAFANRWEQLPESLLVRDLAAQASVMAQLPPRLIRPRVEAEFVKVVQIGAVRTVGYHPGDQRLTAVIEDQQGETALVSAAYQASAPGALDALAQALCGQDEAAPRYLSGMLHRTQGGIVIDPLAVVVGRELVVLDLAAGDGTEDLAAGALGQDLGPIEQAVGTAGNLLAEVAHQGLRHLQGSFPARLSQAAADLNRCGMSRTAASLEKLVSCLGPDPDTAAVAAWADAQIRVSVTDECL